LTVAVGRTRGSSAGADGAARGTGSSGALAAAQQSGPVVGEQFDAGGGQAAEERGVAGCGASPAHYEQRAREDLASWMVGSLDKAAAGEFGDDVGA
jgi:hypothetical protein